MRTRLFDLHRQADRQGPCVPGFEEVRILPPQLAAELRKRATASLTKARPAPLSRSLWHRLFGR